jgi:hypothetical protein
MNFVLKCPHMGKQLAMSKLKTLNPKHLSYFMLTIQSILPYKAWKQGIQKMAIWVKSFDSKSHQFMS